MSDILLTEIVRQINTLQANKMKPVMVRMCSSTWDRVKYELECLSGHPMEQNVVFGLEVKIDPAVVPDVVRVLIAWT